MLKPFVNIALALSMVVVAGAQKPAAAASYTLVTEPTQGLSPLYTLINSAQHTIDMTMYELSDTTAEQDLVNQAAAGVTVRVILDQNLEKSNNQAAYTFLSDNGVQVHWANPVYAATHQKTITIDGAYSFAQTAIMTLNLTPQYYSTSRDFAVIENDLNDIAAIETTFQADFTNASITPPLGDELVWSPTNAQSAMTAVINGAQHSLQVENEEMSDTAIVSALESAAKRGVNVQIIMTNTSNTYSTEWNALTAAGADVATYASTASLYIHAKVILADYGYPAATVFVGSENFSSASLTENRELGLIFSIAPILTSLNATLISDFLGGTPWSGSPADFTLSANPTSLTVAAGQAGSSTITCASFNSFKSAVALTATGLPTGVTAAFSPSSISGGKGTSTLTLTVSSSVVAGTYGITVVGTSGSVNDATGVTLTVTGGGGSPNFTLSASPSSVSVQAGSAATSTISSTATGGFTSAVSLSASGLPSGVTAAFSPSSISGGAGSSTLTLTAGSSATAGTTAITITGTGGGVTHTTPISLTVTAAVGNPSFTLTATPAALTVAQSSAGTTTIASTVSGGFSSTITLSASGLPAGVTAGFNPATLSGAGSSVLTLTASSSAAVGNSTVTVTGTGGGVTASTTVALTITSSGSVTQLITDGGFESATKSGLSAPGWTATTNLSSHNVIEYHGSHPHTGSNYAQLGGKNSDNDTLTQTITIPAGSTSTPLTFWVSISTAESNGSAYDYLYVEIHNTSGTLLATPLTLSNLNSTSDGNTEGTYFQPQTVDLSAYAGETVELVFHGTTDYEDITTFLVDDVSVTAN